MKICSGTLHRRDTVRSAAGLQRKDVAKRVPEEAGRGDWFGGEAESDLNSIQRIQSPAFTTAATPSLEKCGIFRCKNF